MINNFDYELINKIIEPLVISKSYIRKKENSFLGYKKGDYFSFFFSLCENVLTLTFRYDTNNLEKTRVYVTYDNISVIRTIIKSVLESKILDVSYYDNYIYTRDLDSAINEPLDCHWTLPGLVITPDPNGDNISTLNISERLMNALYRYDILTIKQFMELDINLMKKMKLLGKRSFREALKLKSLLCDDCNCVFDEYKIKNEFFDVNVIKFYESNIDKYEMFGEKIINQLIEVVEQSHLSEREKDIFIKYNNLYLSCDRTTLENLGIQYGISGERVRQIAKRLPKKLKIYKNKFIPFFNDIIGEDQYSYLIEGVKKIFGDSVLKSILFIVFTSSELNKIENVLNKYAEFDKSIISKKTNYYVSKPKNNGSLWELAEEQQLVEEFIMGKSIEEIALIHDRTYGGIRSRLRKLQFFD